MSTQVERLWGRGGIELWRSCYGHYDRPAFIVITPKLGVDYFPSFEHPNNGYEAIKRVRELRAAYGI